MGRKKLNTCETCGIHIFRPSLRCRKHAYWYKRKSEETRFWEKVKKINDGCWEWIASLDHGGYGKFMLAYDVEKPKANRNRKAHRYSWELLRQEIPPGMYVDHMCRNKRCVNPDHLRVVTPLVNSLENSNSVSALRAKSDTCPNGHKYTLDTIQRRYRPSIDRVIRTCMVCYRARTYRNNHKTS